jgi:N-methylhydantoinase A
MSSYRLGIDVGGTFTDLLAFNEQGGELLRYKVPSVPQAPEEGVLAAIHALQRDHPGARIERLHHSTTLATNALLGQLHLTLPRLALLTTAGFRDVLEIGRQGRSEVYNLFVRRPAPLVARQDRFGVRERLDASGQEVEPLDKTQVRAIAAELRTRGIRDCAICFLHSYQNAAHEEQAREVLLEEYPHLTITLSSACDPQEREYERTSTTVVNALLAPIVRRYLSLLEKELQARDIHAPLSIMQSNGGMAAPIGVLSRPASIIESGPASGVVGAAYLGQQLNIPRLLCFDMGGTTAKAGTILGALPQVVNEFEAAGRTHSGRAVRGSGYPVRFPFIDLAEISAGGGSIAWIDEAGAIRVGPQSAGANPGPACYGLGNLEPTVTDANLALGRLPADKIADGSISLDRPLAEAALSRLAAKAPGFDVPRLARGILRLVNTNMAKVLRIVSLERGHDPRAFTLVAFGGAGPLHACALAQELSIPQVLVPPHPGLFSSWGLLVSDQTHISLKSLLMPASQQPPEQLEAVFQALEAQGRQAFTSQGLASNHLSFRRRMDIRYLGQSFDLTIPVPAALNQEQMQHMLDLFHEEHARVYGYADRQSEIELVTARVESVAELVKPALPEASPVSPASVPGHAALAGTPVLQAPVASSERLVGFDDVAQMLPTPIYQRETLQAGNRIAGPAIIEQYDATTLLPPGWQAIVDRFSNLLIERANR